METKKMEASSIQDILEPFLSRKLLYFQAYHQPHQAAATPPSSHDHFTKSSTLKNTLDANVIMVVSVLLCALICSFCLNSMIRCALRCSTFISSDNSNTESLTGARLSNTGIKKQALRTFPVVNYSGEMKLPGLECVICLSEFAPGERIRVLPECNHRFHVKCIDRWLNSHSSCPTCRHCLIETTCHKTFGTDALVSSVAPTPDALVSSVAPPPEALVSNPAPPLPGPPQETIVRIAPLEPEGFIRNHHT